LRLLQKIRIEFRLIINPNGSGMSATVAPEGLPDQTEAAPVDADGSAAVHAITIPAAIAAPIVPAATSAAPAPATALKCRTIF
jgi:hypothetical protein